jgi:lipopolysaccharide transport system ATP-binding protein
MSSKPTQEYAIEVAGLSKCYQIYSKPSDRLKQMLWRGRRKFHKDFWALKNISFKIKKGETVGIIGRNGSGKSTLLQLICGTLNPSAGSIEVNGKVAALLELGAGFNPEFTGVENVYLAASLYGLDREDIEKRFDQIAAFADIGEHIQQPVKTYSSGMYVRLAFAVIAHVDADVLVIDEALAVGDVFFTQKCMRFLRAFMATGTVLFVSHDTSSVRSLCSHAIWLDAGGVIDQGTPKQVCDKYLEAIFQAHQGAHGQSSAQARKAKESNRRDLRNDFINNSSLRNDIALFEFDPGASSFGKRLAEIVDVGFFDRFGQQLSWIVGGEDVVIRVTCHISEPMGSPIVGFHIKDRLGQTLFGDNTYISTFERPVACQAGVEIVAEFDFQMPRLALGDYSVSAAIADGTQSQHVQHHWIHDALHFRSESTSVSSGIIGIPMNGISLKIKEESSNA